MSSKKIIVTGDSKQSKRSNQYNDSKQSKEISSFSDNHMNRHRHRHRCNRCNHYLNRCGCMNKMYKYYKNSCVCSILLKIALVVLIIHLLYKLINYNFSHFNLNTSNTSMYKFVKK
jgi:hypothetical protein